MTKFLLLIFSAAGLIALAVLFFVPKTLRSPAGFIAKQPSPTTTPVPALILQTPTSGQTLSGPLVIKGQVPKSWTFEGQFRMQLLDDRRRLIISGRVPVEWDYDHDLPLLHFIESYNYHTQAKSGFLVLLNDNPSDLPENELKFEIPLKFSPPASGTVYLFRPGTGNPQIDNQCEVVLPQPVDIGVTQTPIKDTLNLLARSMHPDFYVKQLNLAAGLLTVEFPVINSFTSGGTCAQGINFLQIKKTALQFPEVKQIKIIPESLFQP